MTDTPLTIGGLSRAAGVPTSTVRFYERRGLLRPDGRSRGNYRVYGEASLARVRFIRAAHDAGFTLADTARLLEELDGGPECCRHVQGLVADRLEKAAAQIEQLERARGVLSRWLAECRRAATAGRCVILEHLATGPTTTPGPVRRSPKKKPKKDA